MSELELETILEVLRKIPPTEYQEIREKLSRFYLPRDLQRPLVKHFSKNHLIFRGH